MSSRIKVIANTLGSGDWVIITLNGEAVFSGHSIGPHDLAGILDAVQGFEFGGLEEVTDEELDNELKAWL